MFANWFPFDSPEAYQAFLQTEEPKYPGTAFPEECRRANKPMVIPVRIWFHGHFFDDDDPNYPARRWPSDEEHWHPAKRRYVDIPYVHNPTLNSPTPNWIIEITGIFAPWGAIAWIKESEKDTRELNVYYREGSRIFQRNVVEWLVAKLKQRDASVPDPVHIHIKPERQWGPGYIPMTLNNLSDSFTSSSGVVVQFCLKGPPLADDGRGASRSDLIPWEIQKVAYPRKLSDNVAWMLNQAVELHQKLYSPSFEVEKAEAQCKTWVLQEAEEMFKELWLRLLGKEKFGRKLLQATTSKTNFSQVQIVTPEGLERITEVHNVSSTREFVRQISQAKTVTVFVTRNPYLPAERTSNAELKVGHE